MYKVIIDTSVLIDHLRGLSDHLLELEMLKTRGQGELFIPYVVIAELFAGEEAKKKYNDKRLHALIGKFSVIGLSIKSAKIAGELMCIYKQIPDPIDLVIAAIAIEQEAQIATLNAKHFKQIRGVRLFKLQK